MHAVLITNFVNFIIFVQQITIQNDCLDLRFTDNLNNFAKRQFFNVNMIQIVQLKTILVASICFNLNKLQSSWTTAKNFYIS